MNKKLLLKLKHLRIQAGFTQEQMADKLNMSHSSYQRMEKGKTKVLPYYLNEIAIIFEMDESELVNEDIARTTNQRANTKFSDLVNAKDRIIVNQQKLIEEKDKIIRDLMMSNKGRY
jgi:transcriptional regulator with XRE-family HTH domain